MRGRVFFIPLKKFGAKKILCYNIFAMARMIHYQRRQKRATINLNPELSHGLLALFLFIVAGLSILSFFSLAGVAGQFIDSLLALIFGQVRYVFPIVLIISAVLLIKDVEYDYRHTHSIGAVLFFFSFNGFIHLQKPLEEMVQLALQGYGGGVVGLAFAWPLLKYVGYWGGSIILLGLFIASIIFLFNTSLARLVEIHKKALLMFGWLGKQIISFFGSFKKEQKVEFSIKGDYQKSVDPEVDEEIEEEAEDETIEEEKRIFAHKAIDKKDKEEQDEEETEDEEIAPALPRPVIRNLPSFDLLYTSKSRPSAGDIKGNAETIKDTLKNFGIGVEMGEVRIGPTVAQYSFKPDKGVKLSRITTLSNDLALALAAHPIRIEAPIPGQSLVGVEVPNEKIAMVTLRELLEGQEFKHRQHNLMIALGKDVAGKVWFADLPKMPHLLIAGATGSGKTVCINTLILSLIYQNTAETLRFIMVDPKRVELTLYNGIPHLLTPVITDAAKTVNALKWTIGEMERRFGVLAEAGKRDIGSYNAIAADPLPHIVFVIDELADLMAMAASEVEAGIIRLAQMSRAVGIHLIVPGAEKLLGRGDMLLLTADLSKPKRIQGAFVSEEEIDRLVEYLKGDEPPTYDDSIVSKGGSGGTINMFGGSSDDQDALFQEAKQLVIESGKASASLLQRRLKVGYARAARLLDELEEAGIVGPADGAKPREVFADHLMPEAEAEIPDEEQTMDAGGTVFMDEEKTDEEKEPEI
ncbi:MAG: Cell division protein FtsK/SpoIIIE [Candidatus Magasanikbacteria bacterium GW2011_GWA2_37_8]|uniref:Cell division protein FtsK/SpoIIIE n=1 Tax=Candidatus Magasanikbacteria bacterium GW2011_GWA2_37_8 TaxID=1619036 RepID=A0A0G0KHY3_9BACT|nr:MAG: Cell division protein FtsK/SpoIIIE [Candidatus Magasanikbacteria bacterium GW2011_GWA2_37_8]